MVLPRAYHIEVTEHKTGWVTKLLQLDYSSQKKESPLGIQMHAVLDVNTCMNFATRAKRTQIAVGQLTFEEKMGYMNSWEILHH